MAYRTIGDRILVQRANAQETRKSGLLLPEIAREKPQEGTVVVVGPGLRNKDGVVQPLMVHEGERILFGKTAGTEVKLNGETLLIMKEEDVIGVID